MLMTKSKLIFATVLLTQAWTLEGFAMSPEACAMFAKHQMTPPAGECDSPISVSPSTKPTAPTQIKDLGPKTNTAQSPHSTQPESKAPINQKPVVVPKSESKTPINPGPVVVAKPEVKSSPDTVPTSVKHYSGPQRTLLKDNESTFADYCKAEGGAKSASAPQPNYDNPEVQEAAAILSKVAEKNFYFYGDILRIYKAGSPKPVEAAKYSENAHNFLVQTCGEFRDRAEMIKGKINWVRNMVLLSGEAQKPIDIKRSIWPQLSGHSYNAYIQLSGQVFAAKKSKAMADTYLSEHLHPQAQEPVPAYTVCETKYLFSEYVTKAKQFDGLDSYLSGKEKFESLCSQEDKDYYFDFRGDSNFKQYSPESNAMLWHAISIARFCKSSTESNGKSPEITDETCSQYFSNPFSSRYNAARSGLGAWLTYSKAETSGFQNQGANVTVLPSFSVKDLGRISFRMKLSDGSLTHPNAELGDSSLGFNDLFQLGTPNADKATAFERLRNAVNRHTNWYKSSYDDQLGHAKSLRDQAYSPFVASSYDMSASNAFTECGYTVQCDGDGRKAWMLVFRIHKDNWYNTRSLAENKLIDFDKMWIDETTFGTDGLAESEKAFDRLGTALETELDTIVYLHNLSAGSGQVVANDSLK